MHAVTQRARRESSATKASGEEANRSNEKSKTLMPPARLKLDFDRFEAPEANQNERFPK